MTDYEVEDFPTLDGLETKMRFNRGPWQPYDQGKLNAYLALSRGVNRLDQDVWWTGKDGITLAIDDIPDDRRRFIARMLVTNAAAMHARSRARQIHGDFWAFLDYSQEKGWGPVSWDDEPTNDEIRDTINREQDAGAHLDWVRGSVLFQRMIRGLDWVHPGVLADNSIEVGQ